MIKLYSMKDRIPIKIDDITVTIAPLSYKDKQILKGLMEMALKKDTSMDTIIFASKYAIKCCVKKVEGIIDSMDQIYKVQFEDNKQYLTDDCVEDLLALPITDKLICTCSTLIKGIPDEITNPYTGKRMDGVKVLPVKEPDPLLM